jgi:hypothetical protein
MSDIIDKKGNPLYVGDTIDIGGLQTEIRGFKTINDGSELMAETEYGDFNVSIVEKVK